MHRNVREPLLDCFKQVRIIAKWQVRVRPALHQNFRSAYIDRFLNFLENHFVRKHISLIRTRLAVKSTKTAVYVAYVGIVDISPDDERRNRFGMLALHQNVRGMSHLLDFIGLVQPYGIFQIEAPTLQRLV
ncbi:hypothetical protein D3C74_338150 [compost metagenome]